MITLVLFLLILSVLVVAHEWGHFIVARLSGMRVMEFGVGFPPRAFGIYRDPATKKWVWVWGSGKKQGNKTTLKNTIGAGEGRQVYPATLYSVNWLPLGGFCNIKGENGDEEAEVDSFGHKTAWRRFAVVVAGVVMNFLVAALIFSGGFLFGLPSEITPDMDSRAIIVHPAEVIIGQVEKNSPADAAGVLVGDVVKKLNDTEIKTSAEMIAFVQAHGDTVVTVHIARGSEEKSFLMTPKKLSTGDQFPRLGVSLADSGVVRYPWYLALPYGFRAAAFGFVAMAISLFSLVKGLVLGQGLLFDVSGPVGIASAVGQSARLGFAYLMSMAATISLSLAVMNILPIPALDGGRALFIIIEKVFRKKVPMKYEQIAHTIGFVLLMILIVTVTVRDVRHLF